ncbi:MAG: flagellar biosynthesis protein FlhF [Thermodesulfobacteriota bacterium]
MRIKRFEAADSQSAMLMVKDELGEDAVILSTRVLKDAAAGKGTKPRVEVVAAMEYDREPLVVPPPEIEEESGPSPAGAASYGPSLRPAKTAPKKSRPSEFDRQLAAKAAQPSPAAPPASKEDDQDRVHFEAHDLRGRFADFVKRQASAKAVLDARAPGRPEAANASRGKRPDAKEVAQWRDSLISQLPVRPLAVSPEGGPAIIALTGPTGVGKTTTAAKIAAWYSIHQRLKVALLSMDCYRIGATDQLRTYARIMRLPCEVALRKRDLVAALDRQRDKDLIIIDTAGKSPYDPDHVRELAEWFSLGSGIEPYLVLSATCKKEDIQQILLAYDPLGIKGLILAKLDETRAYAALCQQLATSPLPISCLCTGQRVPEDFLPASREFLHLLFAQGWQAAADAMASRTQPQWA